MNLKRMRTSRKSLVAVAALLMGGLGLLSAGPSPLIPRRLVFAPSERGNPVLSPDGQRIAYSAALDGIENLWLKTVGRDDDRPITNEKESGIPYGFWQADGEHMLFFKDAAGDENSHLFQVNVRTGKLRDLTPVPGAQAKNPIMDPAFPDTILIHLNARDKRLFDVHRIDLRTVALTPDAENSGDVARFYADHQMRIRAAYVNKPDGSAEVRVRDSAHSPWRTILRWGSGEMSSDATGIVGFTADDSSLLVVTSLEANAERLLEVNAATGSRKVIGQDPLFDVAAVMIHPRSGTLEAIGFEKESRTWAFLDDAVRRDFDFLKRVRAGAVTIRSRDRSDHVWLVRYAASDRPTVYYHYDRTAHKAAFLFSEDPKLEPYTLAPKRPVTFRALDGMPLHGYLTLPAGRPARRLPLVVMVHGGPWTRDTAELDFPVQGLANRGYAVLQVNFRGSTGYGKDYQNAGNLEWGGKVIQDLIDGKNWAVARGYADPGRTAILGGSFGGYASLAAMAFHPLEFKCGVAISAMSDTNLFLASMPPQWTVSRARFEIRMGKDPDFLKSISPVHRADRVRGPLLVIHNANDTRLKPDQAERMVAALRQHGKDIVFLLFPGAGHVSAGIPLNLLKRWAAIEDFLGRHLGGRVEPPAEDERWEAFLK